MVFIFIVSWPKLVPAVAVRQERLALLIFIRFKGYLDGLSILIRLWIKLEFYVRGVFSIEREEIIFFYTFKTGNGENNPLCNN
jgi:hypothetical protein